MEIRHIPGKRNPADTITKEVKADDQVYAREVKQMDNELMDPFEFQSKLVMQMFRRSWISCTIRMGQRTSSKK